MKPRRFPRTPIAPNLDERVFVATVTWYYTGYIVKTDDNFVHLADAWLVFDATRDLDKWAELDAAARAGKPCDAETYSRYHGWYAIPMPGIVRVYRGDVVTRDAVLTTPNIVAVMETPAPINNHVWGTFDSRTIPGLTHDQRETIERERNRPYGKATWPR